MNRELARAATAVKRLAIELGANGELPTEFRLFVPGWNETENGRFLFDKAASKATMDAYAKWGVDLMIDLEHQSLEPGTPPEPTARDARGWCNLELRTDGSLWAINVSWTADGAARLKQKRQRYVSPAFGFDKESRRVTSILNVAITSIPATHDTPALVAARAAVDLRKLSAGPAFSDIQMAINEALSERFPRTTGPDPCMEGPWVVDVFDATVVYVLEGELFEVAYTYDGKTATLGDVAGEVTRSYTPAASPAPPATTAAPAAPAQAPAPPITTNTNRAALAAGENTTMPTMLDPKLAAKALEVVASGDQKGALELLQQVLASAAGADPEDAPAPAGDGGADETAEGEPPVAAAGAAPAAGAADDPKKKDAMAAAARVAMSLTGLTDPAAAMAELSRRSKVAVEVEQREAQLSTDRATLERDERRTLVASLVKLGVEIPATAWSDDKGTVPCARLGAEPIAELRSRVAKLTAASGGQRSAVKPPPGEATELSDREKKICAEKKIDPAKYAAMRADIRSRSNLPNVEGA